MHFTSPNNWVCPLRPMCTFWWQPTLLSCTQDGGTGEREFKKHLSTHLGQGFCVAPPSCPLVALHSRPLVVLSLATLSPSHHAIWLLRRLSSRCRLVLSCPLTAPPSRHLIAQAGCCAASRCAAVSSSRRAAVSSSCRAALLSSHCPLTC